MEQFEQLCLVRFYTDPSRDHQNILLEPCTCFLNFLLSFHMHYMYVALHLVILADALIQSDLQ